MVGGNINSQDANQPLVAPQSRPTTFIFIFRLDNSS